MPVHCERCGKEIISTLMSRFNSQHCCWECIEREQKHPRYREAYDAEWEACERGEYNFPGIGLPPDLQG